MLDVLQMETEVESKVTTAWTDRDPGNHRDAVSPLPMANHRSASTWRPCLCTTDGWSKHWVNDRPMPRRPYIHQPRAWEIDQHLKKLLPEFVGAIPIE
jgi:hypothetical protein